MKLVTQTDRISQLFGEKTAISVIKEAGFDAIDCSMFSMQNDLSSFCADNYREYAEDIKTYADSLGIEFVQGHAPFPSFDASRPEYNAKIEPRIIRSIEISGILGLKHLIIHPISPIQKPNDADLKEFNLSYYRALLPYAKEYGVTVCLENMWGWDDKRGYIVPNVCSLSRDLAEYVDELDSEYFAACLDLGHSALVGEDVADAIITLGHDRLKALHVHDNGYRSDDHKLPFQGKLDWSSITAALGRIKYAGNLTFEADNFMVGLPADKELFLAAERYMESVGRYLIKKIGL